MRKVTSFLFISLDGVVEAPDKFVRSDLYEDFPPLTAESIAEQDAVLLGRKTYDEWSGYWPQSTIEPFASFINNTPKYVVSKTLKSVDWPRSTLISGNLGDAIAALKKQPGKTIGVHGSISLVQSLLTAGLLDELRFTLIPAVAGHGRRMLSRDGQAIQLTLESTRATPSGLQYMIFVLTPSDALPPRLPVDFRDCHSLESVLGFWRADEDASHSSRYRRWPQAAAQ